MSVWPAGIIDGVADPQGNATLVCQPRLPLTLLLCSLQMSEPRALLGKTVRHAINRVTGRLGAVDVRKRHHGETIS